MPATEDAQERGLAAAIRAKEEAARTLGQVNGEVIQNQGLAARFEGVLVISKRKGGGEESIKSRDGLELKYLLGEISKGVCFRRLTLLG